MAKKQNLVSVSECARITGFARETLKNFIEDEGMPVVESSGRKGKAIIVDTAAVVQWLLSREKDDTPLALERILKVKAERKKIEAENAAREGVTLLTDDVLQNVSMLIVTLKNVLQGSAGRIAEGNAVLREKVLGEHRRVLVQFYHDAADWLRRSTGVEVDPPPALTSRVAVGRRKKNPAKRGRRTRSV